MEHGSVWILWNQEESRVCRVGDGGCFYFLKGACRLEVLVTSGVVLGA